MILKEALKDAVNCMCTFVQVILSALLFFENSPVFWAFLIDILIFYSILKSPIAFVITDSIRFIILVFIIFFLSFFISALLDKFRDYLRNQKLWRIWK